MRTFILSLSFLISYSLIGQDPTFEWGKSLGSSSDDAAYSITTDLAGNIYTTGRFSNTVDFDPGTEVFNLTSNGILDIFVQKLDVNGDFLWAKNMGGEYSDDGYSIATDVEGNVYTTGDFALTVDFDPGVEVNNITSNGDSDIFIQKLDANGNFLWVKTYGGEGADVAWSIRIDSYGNLYTTGVFQDTVDFDPGINTYALASVDQYDVFVQKLDSDGNFIWAKSMGSIGVQDAKSIYTDQLDNVYTGGRFEDTVDFDPGAGTFNLTSSGSSDIFIQKLDSDGNFMWAKKTGSTGTESLNSVLTDASDNVYATGQFSQTVDFDPGNEVFNLTSNGGSDVYIQKLDPDGNFIWAKNVGGSEFDWGFSLATDTFENLYVTGYFHSTTDFDPGPEVFNLTSNGENDIFILKLDSNGNFVWAKNMGSDEVDSARSITVDLSGNIFTAGQYKSTMDIDPTTGVFEVTSNGNSDIFIQKLAQCTTSFGSDLITVCDSLIWIDGETYSESNNSATFTLTNSAGCDSIVTLNLTINTVDITVTQDELNLTSEVPNALYQWLDCDNNFSALPEENNQSFTATDNGNYALEISLNDCTDTSSCYLINSVNIFEYEDLTVPLIFPNPIDQKLSIDLGSNFSSSSIRIFDVCGKLLLTRDFNNSQLLSITLDAPPGVYLLMIESDKQTTVHQLVKE